DFQPPKGPPVIGIKPPRQPVIIEPLETLGVVVIRAQNPEDMKAVLDLIKYIQDLSKDTQVTIHIVPLKYQDATSLANTLRILFSNVQVGPYTNQLVIGQQRTGAGGGAQPGVTQPGGGGPGG